MPNVPYRSTESTVPGVPPSRSSLVVSYSTALHGYPLPWSGWRPQGGCKSGQYDLQLSLANDSACVISLHAEQSCGHHVLPHSKAQAAECAPPLSALTPCVLDLTVFRAPTVLRCLSPGHTPLPSNATARPRQSAHSKDNQVACTIRLDAFHLLPQAPQRQPPSALTLRLHNHPTERTSTCVKDGLPLGCPAPLA